MRIPAQTKAQILRLIEDGSSVHPSDLEALHRWMQATYETLQFDSVQQQIFDEHCRSSRAVTRSMRLSCGVSMLKQALYKQGPENYILISTQV
ncbi:MAG TPA: hypothetical protein VMC85_15645 [Desulfomonilaceae bacterium]|nr:hypothetical protein [Desulfomonilaceae bacterium]